MFEHDDVLATLNSNAPLPGKLQSIHDVVRRKFPFIERIAVALYDAGTDTLKTFVHSSGVAKPLSLYESRLADTHSLKEIVERGKPRVVQDLTIFATSQHEHSKRILGQGYRASYTLPMYQHAEFLGFLFFNSSQPDCFNEEALQQLDLFGHLIALTIINELASVRTLVASVQAARHVTHHRDVETGAHVNRTAHYARLIAKQLAPKYGLTDEYVENVFLFSPLHDIGKIGVPDDILHKPSKLTDEEYEVMKTHVVKGREIIDDMLSDFGLHSFGHADILRNIAQYHHENVDGSGYPAGLKGANIPLESRISAVADVFDALTSKRPYKRAWSNDEAVTTLRQLVDWKLDRECVDALVANMDEVERIQHEFKDELY